MPTQVINGMSITPGSDSITTTDKITAGYFTGGDGTLASDAWTTASITDSVETYYYGIAKDSPTGSVQFHVAYGNANGKGSNSDSDNIKSPTEAIYNQWTNILLPEFEITGGFFISADKVQTPSDSHLSSGTRDTDFYVLLGQRSLFKDRINKKNWTIQLSGSSDIAGEAGLQVLSLTDDSQNIPPVYTPAGPRYNIVSGSSGTVVSASSKRNFGFFYPDQGVWLFSGAELSRSLPGTSGSKNTAVNFISKSTGTAAIGSKDAFGFQEPTTETSDLRQALRFVNCMKLSGSATHTTQTMRSEEDQTQLLLVVLIMKLEIKH